MSRSNFIDRVGVACASGDGGDGCVHFKRSRSQSQGGADGGDGGKGGDVLMRGNKQHWTLLHLRYKRHIKASSGQNGGHSRRSGSYGKDVLIEVPLGTRAYCSDSQTLLGEVLEDGETYCLLAGGKGGYGNARYVNTRRQSPDYAQCGKPGQKAHITFSLRLLADVGLVGMPNAGKSTLLARLSAARPDIAPYPFTTLEPVLGVVAASEEHSFVMADLPGLIEGAAKGKGLGLQFLQHVERNSLLIVVLSCEHSNIKENYDKLLHELKSYDANLLAKPRIILISKCDLIDHTAKTQIQTTFAKCQWPLLFVSSHTQKGLQSLRKHCWAALLNR